MAPNARSAWVHRLSGNLHLAYKSPLRDSQIWPSLAQTKQEEAAMQYPSSTRQPSAKPRKPLSTLTALASAPLVALLLLAGSPAHAGGGSHSYHAGFSNFYVGGNYHRGHRYRGHHSRRHYRRNHHRYNGRHHYRGHRYHRNRNNEGAYIIGGLVVGSLLTHAWHRNQDARYERRVVEPYRRTDSSRVYAAGTRRIADTSAPVSRHLFRDAQGDCFEKQQNDAGEELMIELPAEDCRW